MKDTEIYQLLAQRNKHFSSIVDKLLPIVTTRLEVQVPKIFPDFTLHNIEHSRRIVEYIPDLVKNIELFNDFELLLIILSAMLHDIGMSLGKDDIDLIKKDAFFEDNIHFKAYENIYSENAISEIIRQYHADISSLIIAKDSRYSTAFTMDEPSSLSFLEDIKILCKSHTKENLWLIENLPEYDMKGKYSYNIRFISYLLRIADLLDIDQSRTPYELYLLINPSGISNDEWRQHFIVTNTKKVVQNTQTGLKDICLYGESRDIKIHRKLMVYVNWINIELSNFIEFCNFQVEDKYKNTLSNTAKTKIKTIGFTISDYKLSLDFSSITELLMGKNIYGDSTLALREIIQNSIDACLVRKEIESERELDYVPTILIKIDTTKNLFCIVDNGIGMSEEIIKKFFLNIGRSYYKSDLFKLNNLNYKPIGSFGIGFLSCFMLSEDVKLITRYYKNNKKYTIQLEKGNEFISFDTVEDVSFIGTTIYLNLNEVFKEFQNQKDNILKFISLYFINDDYKLKWIVDGEVREIENSILRKSETRNNKIIDDISIYMEGCTGFIEYKNTHSFIREIEDLRIISDNVFFIENNKVKKMDKKLCEIIDKSNDSIKFIHIPLYNKNDEYKFIEILDILDDDIDAAIAKIESEDDLYIFFPIEDQGHLEDLKTYSDPDYEYVDDIPLSLIVNEVGDNYFYPKAYMRQVTIYIGENSEILEEYKQINNYSFSWLNEKNKLYLRNIFIKNYSFSKQQMVKTIDLEAFRINVYNKNIVPDISRNSLLFDSTELINNSINIAVHLSSLEHCNFKLDEENLIIEFITNRLLQSKHIIKSEIIEKYLKKSYKNIMSPENKTQILS